MNTILVTGGAGFIGSCFVRQLVGNNSAKVVVLDKLTYAGNLDSLIPVEGKDNYVFVQGGIEDKPLVSKLLSEHKPQAIVNFAAESHVDRSIDGPIEFVMTNVVGTVHLLEAARGYWDELSDQEKTEFRFLHVSTDEVYGSLGSTGLFTEETKYAPNSPYSASKASSDHFVRAYHHTYGLPVLITNCSNNYGPYQFPEKLIPLMILNTIEGKPLPVYGDGLNVRDWLYVGDHCDAIWQVLTKGTVAEVYNIGGNSERTNMEIVNKICETVESLVPNLPHAPAKSLITFVTDRPGHDRRYAIDATKIKNELGWTPKYEFESALRETVQWYINNSKWVQRVTDGSYARERLGNAKA